MRNVHFWLPQEVVLLQTVPNFKELGGIAVSVLKRMSETKKEIVQLCGPMSTGGLGCIEKNFDLFGNALDVAIGHELFMFDQIPFQNSMQRLHGDLKAGEYCNEILEVFYRMIFESGYVKRTLFLPGWNSSFGATWERNLVSTLPIQVEEYPADWYKEALKRMRK